MTETSARFATVPPSGIREIFDLALTIPDAIHLEIGAPDFPTPDHIVEAAARAAREGFTRYTPTGGLPSLRELIADKVRRRNGMDCGTENVIAAAGGCCALYAAIEVLIDEGDAVLIPDPAWPVYEMATLSLGGEVQRYPLLPEAGFEPDLDALEAAITPRTRVLVANSPGNPTGGVHRRETVEALVALASRHDLWLVSDEAYEDFVFEGEHVTTGSLDGAAERVIGAYTFSKTYSMTGWRVGYLVAPESIVQAVTIALEPLIACPSSVSQKAAEAALAGPQDTVAEMREAFERRRDLATELLDSEGVSYVRPHGSFYMVVHVPGGGDANAFAYSLLEERHVAVAPGDAFGPGGAGMLRVSLCMADADLERGLSRLAEHARAVA
jgi:aspartate/methionine/tyrosine aminotransferase